MCVFRLCVRVHLRSLANNNQNLVDDDRAETVWGRYTKLLYPRGQTAVLEGEELHVGRNVIRLGGKRYFLQVCVCFG